MKQTFTCIIFFLLGQYSLQGQKVVDFENLNPGIDTFDNGVNADGGFADGGIWLPNDYDSEFDIWSGWAISSKTDTVTAGFLNQYSAVVGTGADSSQTYAVSYAFDPVTIHIQDSIAPAVVSEIHVTNNTYTYLSMRDGDAFSKKFGGVTGDDPDFLLLQIVGFADGTAGDTVLFYLADYRSNNNEDDYLITDWTSVDLTALGEVDSLQFSLSSSDVGDFGMNTPAYFSLDKITLETSITAVADQQHIQFAVYPNPSTDEVQLILPSPSTDNEVFLYDISGRLIMRQTNLQDALKLGDLTPGSYIIQARTPEGIGTRKLIKQ